MTTAPGRGRPRTRSRAALRFAVWRMVRHEIAYKGAANVVGACEQILQRVGRVRVLDAQGQPIADITDADKLRQWYADAERGRANDADLAALCAAWEAQAPAAWRQAQGTHAALRSVAESERAGLLNVGMELEASEQANAAARSAEAAADPAAMPKPRKHGR